LFGFRIQTNPHFVDFAIASWTAVGQALAVGFRGKIIPLEALPEWRARFRSSGKRLAVTNGCFDLLHAGHISYLESARQSADALLIGLNGDASVRELKGPQRPINSQEDRATVLAALECVNAVCIFPEKTATRFLCVAQPDVYVKGGDYTRETLNPGERQAVEQAGGTIVIIPFVPGKSTTALLQKIAHL
jgi:rfaE bifunctional protein nucleotidyltransferase chain/domain